MNTLGGRFAAQQAQGSRANQEDAYDMMGGRAPGASGFEHTLLVLTDGMGGHSCGEVASRLVTKSMIDTYKTDSGPVSDQLRFSVDIANNRLSADAAANADKKGMGCTLVAAVITRHGLEWISIGDSPMWIFSAGVLRRLNADHSMAPVLASLVEAGRMDAEEAATDPKRHALRSAVTGDDIHLIDQSSQPIAIGEKDLLILASDGLETLSEDALTGLLKKHKNEALSTLAARMIRAVEEKHKPNQDNTTVLLYRPDGNYGTPNPTSPHKLPQQGAASNRAGRPVFTSKQRSYMGYAVIGAVLIAALAITYWVNFNPVMPEENRLRPNAPQATEQIPTPISTAPEPEQEKNAEVLQQETLDAVEIDDITPSSLKTPTNPKSEQTE